MSRFTLSLLGAVAVALMASTGSAAVFSGLSLAADEAQLVIDPSTGELCVNLGSNIGQISVVSENALLNVNNIDGASRLGAPVQTSATAIAFSAASGTSLPTGFSNIGNVLPANLEFMNQLSPAGNGTFSNVTLNGTPEGRVLLSFIPIGGGGTRTVGLTISAVPEPATTGVLMAGAAAVYVRRRHRS